MQFKSLLLAMAASVSFVGALPAADRTNLQSTAQKPTTFLSAINFNIQKRGLFHGIHNLIDGLHFGDLNEKEDFADGIKDCHDGGFFHFCEGLSAHQKQNAEWYCEENPYDEYCEIGWE